MSSPRFTIPTFSLDEPGEGQRWSTWPSVTPSERGPRPYPDWVVTSAAAFDTELGILKTGKEADVYLIERAVPGPGGPPSILAAKRYRGPEISDFHRSAQYQEGRRMRNTRDTRAVARGSAYGRSVSAVRWAYAEFQALTAMYQLGVPVPYPVQVNGTEILMEFLGQGTTAAPRLAQVHASAHEFDDYFTQIRDVMVLMARAGVAHGDLSAYNLLVHRGRIAVIDLPQLVEISSNPSGMDLLHRDCVNVCAWFARKGHEADAEALFADLLDHMYG